MVDALGYWNYHSSVLHLFNSYHNSYLQFTMADSLDPHDYVELATMIDRMLNAYQELLVSIHKSEYMVEKKRCSFHLFLEGKLLVHHVEIEDTLEDFKA